MKEVTDIDRERLDFTFKTNIIAMFRLAQLALPHMKPGSSIINTSSIQAYTPSPGILDYAASKVCARVMTEPSEALLSVLRLSSTEPRDDHG